MQQIKTSTSVVIIHSSHQYQLKDIFYILFMRDAIQPVIISCSTVSMPVIKMSLFEHFHAVWLLIYIWDRPLRWGIITEMKIGFLLLFLLIRLLIIPLSNEIKMIQSFLRWFWRCREYVFFSRFEPCASESNSKYNQKASNQLDRFI